MRHVLYATLLMFALPFIVSCGKDDDVELESYVLGKWHSYKAIAYYPDEPISISLSKTGEGSQSYFEVVFNADGTANVSAWQAVNDMPSQWVTNRGSYVVNGNEVILTESDNSVTHLMLEGKSLYMRGTYNDNIYGVVPIYIYFKK